MVIQGTFNSHLIILVIRSMHVLDADQLTLLLPLAQDTVCEKLTKRNLPPLIIMQTNMSISVGRPGRDYILNSCAMAQLAADMLASLLMPKIHVSYRYIFPKFVRECNTFV
jgi:hypothetical protein